MNKKLLSLAMAGALMLSLAACSSAPADSGSQSAGSQSASTSASASADASKPAELTGPIAESPVRLSTAGQSADVEMVKVLLEKAGIEVTVDNTTDGSDLGGAKTLVLAVGGSSKGLGAAGTDADAEIARVEALSEAADAADMTIIAVHVGGTARRGDLGDKFIAPSFAKADYAVVVQAGDEDGLMSGLAADAGIPMAYAESMAKVVEPLQAAFK